MVIERVFYIVDSLDNFVTTTRMHKGDLEVEVRSDHQDSQLWRGSAEALLTIVDCIERSIRAIGDPKNGTGISQVAARDLVQTSLSACAQGAML